MHAMTVLPALPHPVRDPRVHVLRWLALLFTLLLAVGLFTRFSIDDHLSRDESIFVYGAQQLVKGVPYYRSIFDAKTPLAPILAAVGVEAAKVFGGSQVHAVRIVFLLFACGAAGGMLLLAQWLWNSVLAGVVSSVAFLAFRGFAVDALGGPDAKTPGIAFSIFAMALLVRRRWLWGGVMGALAFLCWQPLGIYMLVAVLAAAAMSDPGKRLRAVVAFVYCWAAGALGQYVDAAFRFPVEGVQRYTTSLSARVSLIADVVQQRYSVLHGWLLWGGLIALAALVIVTIVRGRGAWRTPIVCVVAASFIPLVAFTLHDFEGYPDLYPLLPYAALGAGAIGLLPRALAGRRVAAVVAGVVVATPAALASFTWYAYADAPESAIPLSVQEARADAIQRALGPGGKLYAIGDPTPLVLTHRRNPNRYIYLGSGVLQWMVDRTPGGYAGWLRQIRALDPGVIVEHTFDPTAPGALEFLAALQHGYATRWLGAWRILIKPRLLRGARAGGVVLGTRPPPGVVSVS
jgi:hypothetical protein